MKILLLNPSFNAEHAIVKGLQARGMTLLLATQADEAWQLLQLHGTSIDLAVVHREGMGNQEAEAGLKLIGKIKADSEHADLPIILTSGSWANAEFAAHQQTPQGVNAYLTFPTSDARLSDTINTVLGTSAGGAPSSRTGLTGPGLQAPSAPQLPPAPPPETQIKNFGFTPESGPGPEVVREDASIALEMPSGFLQKPSAGMKPPPPPKGEGTGVLGSLPVAGNTKGTANRFTGTTEASQTVGEFELQEASNFFSRPDAGNKHEPSELHIHLDAPSGYEESRKIERPASGNPSVAVGPFVTRPMASEQGVAVIETVAELPPAEPVLSADVRAKFPPKFEASSGVSAAEELEMPAGASLSPASTVLEAVAPGESIWDQSAASEFQMPEALSDPSNGQSGSHLVPDEPASAFAAAVETPAEAEELADDDSIVQQLPYLYDKQRAKSGKIPEAISPFAALGLSEPVGDAVVPGGAAQAPDAETLKRYLLLREQDVAVLSSQLKSVQDQVASLEGTVREERAKNAELLLISQEQRRKIDDFEKEKAVLIESLQKDAGDLKFQAKSKTEKARLLESQVKEATEEMERLKERVRSDIRKIRVREKELENRLEIAKKDAEALIAARETKIIDLKRKLDLLEFNLDLLQGRFSKERETNAKLKERQVKAGQAMRVAMGLLDALTADMPDFDLNESRSSPEPSDTKEASDKDLDDTGESSSRGSGDDSDRSKRFKNKAS